MSIEIRKKEGESASSLLYRFSKKVKRSGVLREAKKRRFRLRSVNKRSRRLSAIYRFEKAKNIERLKKLGQVK